ncbi:MAG TPA: response regulator, partial [Humisphaera sp.]
PPRPPASRPGTPPNLRGVRVLVVDDDPDARTLVKRALEASDATTTLAGSVDEALSWFDGGRAFDVIVSDIGMPERDGYDLIRSVRGRPGDAGGRTPAVALTAYAAAEDRARAIRAGFDLHVTKPVDPAELWAAVASLAGRHGPAPAGRG